MPKMPGLGIGIGFIKYSCSLQPSTIGGGGGGAMPLIPGLGLGFIKSSCSLQPSRSGGGGVILSSRYLVRKLPVRLTSRRVHVYTHGTRGGGGANERPKLTTNIRNKKPQFTTAVTSCGRATYRIRSQRRTQTSQNQRYKQATTRTKTGFVG